MNTKFVKLDRSRPDLAVIKEAARLVDEGGLVVFPTETVYGIACKANAAVINKLNEAKGRTPEKYYTLHIGQKSDLRKYVANPGLVARQLVKKAWPGPLTVVFELSDEDVAIAREQLGSELFGLLYHDNTIGIRCPDNAIASLLLTHAQGPVVAPSANLTGQPPSTSGEQAFEVLNGRVDMVLDGGQCQYQKSSTVVKVDSAGMHFLREGVYQERDVESMAQVHILFVCTGNTCRSPIAVGLCRKYLAEKLECSVDQLEKMGYKITSAGTMTMAGWPASAEAIEVCRAKGADISNHHSTPVSVRAIEQSDFIFVMTQQHRKSILELVPAAADKCILLAGRDVPDPIGGSEKDYYYCAELIEKALLQKISELVK